MGNLKQAQKNLLWGKYGCLGIIIYALLFTTYPLEAAPFRVGFGKKKITPTLRRPVWLAGFQPKRRAKGIHDELWARTILFHIQEKVFVFTTLDCIGVLHNDLWPIREKAGELYGISPYQIIISATHTHSGPDTIGIWGGQFWKSGKDPAYIKKMEKAVLLSIGAALKSQKPAKIRYTKVNVEPVIKDSRKPVVKDPYLFIMEVRSIAGHPLGTWSNLALHPEVLTGKNTWITSDYAHYLREKLEKEIGGTAVFCVGAIGGMQTPKRQGRGFSESKRIGEWIAQKGIQSLKKEKFLIPTYGRFQGIRVFFPVTNIKFILALYLGLFGEKLKRKTLDQTYLFPFWTLEADIAILEIDKLKVVTLPGELFPELAKKIYASMGWKNTLLIGLANHEIGYILPFHQWREAGYEETMSLGPETSQILQEAIQVLWRRSQKKP